MSMFDNWMGGSKPNTPPAQNNGTPQPTGAPPNQNPNPNPNPQDNSGTNQDLIAQLWDEETKKPVGADPTKEITVKLEQPPAQKTDEQLRAEISTHLSQVGLGDLAITPEDVEKIQGGDYQAFANVVNGRIQQSYMQAIQASQKLVNAQIEKAVETAVEQAVGKSKAFFSGENLRALMYDKMPFTKDPAIGPVAETVFRQFLVKGATKEKALEKTDEYFKRIRSAMDPDYIPPNPNTRTTFRGNPRTTGAESWLDVLKGN